MMSTAEAAMADTRGGGVAGSTGCGATCVSMSAGASIGREVDDDHLFAESCHLPGRGLQLRQQRLELDAIDDQKDPPPGRLPGVDQLRVLVPKEGALVA